MNLTDPVAPLRMDVQTLLSEEDGTEIVLLHDPLDIAFQDVAIDTDSLYILELMDGVRSLRDIHRLLGERLQTEIDMAQLVKFVKSLDDMMYLENTAYNEAIEFIESETRPAVCAGTVYPESPDELRSYLSEILAKANKRAYPANAVAAVIPHIDFRVNSDVYAQVFQAISDAEFDVIVHIGTSHYGWQDRFILTYKDFETPLGTLRTDRELIDTLRERLSFEPTFNDIAYMPEHSLELHHVFLKHMFPDRDFTVLPVLITSFSDIIQTERSPSDDECITEFCSTLKSVVEESGKKALYLVSGDLAHIGKRFGDGFDAATQLDEVKITDYEIMDAMVRGNADLYFRRIADNQDKTRICGLAPVYTMLHAIHPGKGVAFDYAQWDDAPTGSAVTFGSAAWYPA